MAKYKVYVIEDSNGTIVYVGKTSRDLYNRFAEHCSDAKYPEKAQYFTENRCVIKEIYSSDYDYDLASEEQFYIDLYKPSEDLNTVWFNKVRAKALSTVDKRMKAQIMLRTNNTNKGEFITDEDFDDWLDS